MGRRIGRLWAWLPAFVLGCAALPVTPARADTRTDVGLFTALADGSHVGFANPVPVSGIVAGGALELTQHVDRFRLHLEGVPTVSAVSARAGFYGRSSATLSLLNATALMALDPHGRVSAGLGAQFVHLTNSSGYNGDRDDVRIASPIFAVAATLPLPGAHFVELKLMDDPNIRGVLHAVDSTGRSRPDEPEAGAEVDYAAGYGWRRGGVEYLVGGRGLSYHTRNVRTGDLVDRNAGGGVTFELRFLLGK